MSSDLRGSYDHFDSSVWQPSTKPNSAFSPPAIALVAVIASAFLIVTYYRYFLKYCKPCLWTIPYRGHDEVVVQDSDGLQLSASQNFGLDEAVMKKIPICRYRKGENLVLMEGTECAVCLLEFEENECLRILPKCSHAFHINCIDMWLRSHANCPLCRSNVVYSDISITVPPPPAPSPVLLEQNSVIIVINGQETPQDHDSNVAAEHRDTVAENNGQPEVKSSSTEKEAEATGTNSAAMSSNLEANSEHESLQPLRREAFSGLENYTSFYGSLFTSNNTFRCHRHYINNLSV